MTAHVKFRVVNLPDNDYDIDVVTMRLTGINGDDVSFQDFAHADQERLLEQVYTEIEDYITLNHEAIYKALNTAKLPVPAWLH